ncbi:MAG: hypothetical protein RBR06_09475 [Desulfuromonadaceae bacterium]|nr:hypothetical protein [Desulfuromonadaceae bacterium]
MADTEFLSDTKETKGERSTEQIRHDIAKGEEMFSQTVEQIGDRIKEKLDWREYVSDSPYWALGAAAGLGYLASGIFKTRTTPLEQIMDSISENIRDARGGMFARATGPELIKVTLLGVATKAAASWIKDAATTSVTNRDAKLQSQTGGSQPLDRQRTM